MQEDALTVNTNGQAGDRSPQPVPVAPSPAERGNNDYPHRHLTAEDIQAITEAGSKGGTFHCTLCQKKFGYKNGLIRHIRLTHVGEKPYQCNICQRRFGYKHILMEHQNLHFGNRPYACNMCDKKFAARSNLIQHRMVHKRPFNCNMCNKRFDREDQLKKHQFAHPQALLTCNFCHYAAASQTDLNKHMVEHHPPQVMDTRPTSAGSSRRSSDENGQDLSHPDDDNDSMKSELIDQPSPNPSPAPTSTHSGSGSPGPHLATLAYAAVFSSSHNRGHRVESICSQLSSAGVGHNNIPGVALANEHAPPFQGGVIVKKEIEEYDCQGQMNNAYTRPVSPRMLPRSDGTPSPHQFGTTQDSRAVSLPTHPISSISQACNNNMVHPSVSLPHSINNSVSLPQHTNVLTSSSLSSSSSILGVTSAMSRDTTTPIHSLPAIHEVFSRRGPQRVPPTFTNFGVPAMLSPDSRLGVGVGMGMGHTEILLSPPSTTFSNTSPTAAQPLSQQFSTLGNGLNGSGLSTLGTSTLTGLGGRPTAQLPPIAQVLRSGPTKDIAVQHSAPIPGLPALDDVLAYYIAQGRLFKCQHCNIVFFERGMYFLHASLHGSSSPWECSICHKLCSDKNEFTLHFVNQQHNSS